MISDEKFRLIIVIIIASLVFLIPFILVISLSSLIFLMVLVSPAASIVYLLVTINNGNKTNNKGRFNYKRTSIRFPSIVFGFVFVPILISMVIASRVSFNIYSVIILLGLVSVFITSGFYLPLSIYEKYFATKKEKNISSLFFLPPVTIIIPAYNEERVLARALDAIVEADYPNKEVIVVDDGSTDQTHIIALKYKDKFQNINSRYSVISKLNGGKASALNYALQFSKADIVITIDADSIIGRNAIKSIVKYFYNSNVVGVAGYVRVFNSTNFLTNCTALETITAWNSVGRAYSLFGTIMIIPGALGAFRKKRVMERGFYGKDTLTEDFDLTISLLKTGEIIRFDESSLCYTEIPNNLKDLYSQRKRWYAGNFQTLIKHANTLTNNAYGMLHKFGYPMTLFLYLVRPIWSILIPISLALSLLGNRYMPITISSLTFISLQFLISAISVIMDGQKGSLKLILYAPLMIIGYQQILDFILIKSIFDVLFHRNMKWTRAKRLNQNTS
jgi:cellulose synthase/poly-beta-1,6-N-acetylglucosamine synthase-like glycosyltransferase